MHLDQFKSGLQLNWGSWQQGIVLVLIAT